MSYQLAIGRARMDERVMQAESLRESRRSVVVLEPPKAPARRPRYRAMFAMASR